MKWIIVLAIALFSSGIAQTSRLLTLDEAIAIGEKNSKLLRVSAAKVDAAAAKSSELHANLLPVLRLEGSYKRLSDIEPFEIQPPGFPAPYVVSPTVLDNYSVRATVQQPIFTGFRLQSNAKAAEQLAQASEVDSRNDEAQLDLDITSAYWTLYQTMQTKVYVDENVNRLQADLNDTDNLMKAGMATRNDVLKLQVQLSSARLTQIDAANDVQVATMSLNNVMGQPLDTDIRPASVPGIRRSGGSSAGIDTVGSAQELVAKAFESRPDLKAMQFRVEAAKAGVTAAEGSWWPQVVLTGNYYYSRPNARILPAKDEFRSTWDLGVQVQVDVWNWGTTLSQAEQAKASLRQNEALFEQMKDNASLDVQRSYLSLRRAADKIDVATLAVEQAEENARMTSDKFKHGLATSTEIVDADTGLLQARTNLNSALVEYEVARARLKRATGTLH